jgi:hypothetical protein
MFPPIPSRQNAADLPSFLPGLSQEAMPARRGKKLRTRQHNNNKQNANPRLITTSTMTSVTAGYDTCPDWAPAL